MADYNARFAKPARRAFDAHRPLRNDERLDDVLTWREQRRVTKALTVQYDRVLYLLEDTDENRALIHRYIEVWEYPDGRTEIRALERMLAYRQYDRLDEVDQGAIVDNKRLSRALELAHVMQMQRDNRRISGSPSRTNRGIEVRSPEPLPGTKKQREFTREDVNRMVMQLAQEHVAKQDTLKKPGHR
jgi:hypothetical protein